MLTTRERAADLINMVIDQGRVIEIGWYDDGDVESGPRGGSHTMIRLGPLFVESAGYARRDPILRPLFLVWEPRTFVEGYPGHQTIYPGEPRHSELVHAFTSAVASAGKTLGD